MQIQFLAVKPSLLSVTEKQDNACSNRHKWFTFQVGARASALNLTPKAILTVSDWQGTAKANSRNQAKSWSAAIRHWPAPFQCITVQLWLSTGIHAQGCASQPANGGPDAKQVGAGPAAQAQRCWWTWVEKGIQTYIPFPILSLPGAQPAYRTIHYIGVLNLVLPQSAE